MYILKKKTKYIIMSNRLTYKKIFIDSKYRNEQSKSSSDFSIELNENLELPDDTKVIYNRYFYSSGVEIHRGWLL